MSTFAERLSGPLVTPKRVGIVGIVSGMLAFWVALPPIHARSVVAPLILAALGAAAGVYAAPRPRKPMTIAPQPTRTSPARAA